MPTGYTAAVADGKITTLRDFAMVCARGMGALITMRDEPLDAPIPDQLERDSGYYDAELAKAQALLAELPGLSPAECEQRAQAAYDEELRWRTESAAERAATAERYQAMIAAVEAWDCQAEGLKEFMLQQLRESLRFDTQWDPLKDMPAKLSGEEWRSEAAAEAARKVARYSEEIAKAIERTAERNRWLKALRDSLPPEPVPA